MVEKPRDPEDPEDSALLSPQTEERIEQIVQQFLDDLVAGHPVDLRAIVAAHPDLGPVLERRLTVVERVARAVRASSSLDAASGSVDDASTAALTFAGHSGAPRSGSLIRTPEQAIHLNCPHCGNRIQVVQPDLEEVTCRNCGSTFQVDSQATAAPSVRRHPKQIGRFEVLDILGRGGFGVVYKARDPQLDRLVALKTPRSGYFASDDEEQRFLREARHAARLRHPRIVQIHEVGRENGVPYIVSEFIDGLNLADVVSGRVLSFHETAEMVAQLADVLHFAHCEKVIHRDVKPSNVLIDAAGQPYLCDFGLSRRSEGEFTITLDGEVIGTPTYMSPEQASGETRVIDARSDVYSLGVVMYRLLTGELPFRGSRRMLLHQVMHEEARPPRRIKEHIPGDLETVCLKAMAKEPSKRYDTARDFGDDLRRWLNGAPISARPVGNLERVIRWRRRNLVVANLALAIAVLLVSAAIAGGIWALRERGLRAIAVEERTNANTARQQSQQNAIESQGRLVKLQLTNGTERLDEGDWLVSLVWFVAAGQAEQRDSSRDSIHRLRIGSIFRQCPKLHNLWFSHGRIRALEFNATGNRVLAAAEDNKTGRAAVWDLETGAQVGTMLFTSTPIWHATLSPDGKHAAAGCSNGEVHVWDVETGDVLYAPLRHGDKKTEGWVEEVWFSPDGKLLLTASLDRTARLWNVEDGALLREFKHERKVYHARFSPDGTRIATAGGDNVGKAATARLWDTATGAPIGAPMTHDFFIWSTSFSPDGKRLVTTDQGGTAHVWNAETAESTPFNVQHGVPVHASAFSPDGRLIATGAADGLVRICDAETGELRTRTMRHPTSVTQLTFSPDGNRLATGSADQTARLWDVAEGWAIPPSLPHADTVTRLRFDATGRWLLTGDAEGIVKLWDLAITPTIKPALQHKAEVLYAAFSPTKRQVATASRDGTARVWDSASGRELTTKPLTHENIAESVSRCFFNFDGTKLVTSSYDGTVIIWDTASFQQLKTLRHGAPVEHIALDGTGVRLVSTGTDGTAKLWNANTGELLAIMPHDANKRVFHAAFSPDSKWIASASQDQTVRIWRADNGQPVGDPIQHEYWVLRVNFSPDSKQIVTAALEKDRRASIVDLDSRMRRDLYHTGGVRWAWFHPKGLLLLTASSDGAVTLWDAISGQSVFPPWKHGDAEPLFAAFSPDGRLVVSTNERRGIPRTLRSWGNGAAHLWDVQTGFPVTPPLLHRASVVIADFSHDGKQLITASDDGTAQIWDIATDNRPWEDLEALAQLLSGRAITASSGMQPLTNQHLAELWRKLRTKYPESFETSADELQAWRLRCQGNPLFHSTLIQFRAVLRRRRSTNAL